MKKLRSYTFFAGIAFFLVGLLLAILFPESHDIIKTMSFVFIGFGSGIICVGIVGIFKKIKISKNPELAKQYEIAEKDERNIRLREKASYATWFTTLFVLAILPIIFLFLNYPIAIWVTLGALLVHILSIIAYINIYNKKI